MDTINSARSEAIRQGLVQYVREHPAKTRRKTWIIGIALATGLVGVGAAAATAVVSTDWAVNMNSEEQNRDDFMRELSTNRPAWNAQLGVEDIEAVLFDESSGKITVQVEEEIESYEVDIEGYRVRVEGGPTVEFQTGP